MNLARQYKFSLAKDEEDTKPTRIFAKIGFCSAIYMFLTRTRLYAEQAETHSESFYGPWILGPTNVTQ